MSRPGRSSPAALLLLAWALACGRGASAAELAVEEFSHSASVAVPAAGLTRLALPHAATGSARLDLGDLRLVDPSGREVPYLLDAPRREAARLVATESPLVAVDLEETRVSVATGTDAPIDALLLETPAREFMKSLTVLGAPDDAGARPLVENHPIFRQQGGVEDLLVELPRARYGSLSLNIDDRRAAPVAITGLRVRLAPRDELRVDELEVAIVERGELAHDTRLVLRLPHAGLYMTRLRLETSEPLFTREVALSERTYSEGALVERPIASGRLYRVALDGAEPAERLELDVDARLAVREVVLSISNGDSPPLALDRVVALVVPAALVFQATTPGTHELLVGNPRAAAPLYDVASLGGQLASATRADASIGPLVANPRFHPAEPLPQIPELGSAIELDGFSYRRSVAIAASGIQSLELDPAALAHASGSDLRLVREFQQVPYVPDSGALVRELEPRVVPLPADEPGTTRIALELPFERLPVAYLSCQASEPLFERSVSLVELLPDARGREIRRTLGSAVWARRPGATRYELRLPLAQQPITARLELAISNGDNPALNLSGFSVHYTTSRLIFKASATAPTFLYYGKPQLASPRYDIALVAQELLGSEKQAAALGPEESLDARSWWERQAQGSSAQALFWVALIAAVVLLLIVIARLFPRSEPAA